jgi:hypothetical protein
MQIVTQAAHTLIIQIHPFHCPIGPDLLEHLPSEQLVYVPTQSTVNDLCGPYDARNDRNEDDRGLVQSMVV